MSKAISTLWFKKCKLNGMKYDIVLVLITYVCGTLTLVLITSIPRRVEAIMVNMYAFPILVLILALESRTKPNPPIVQVI